MNPLRNFSFWKTKTAESATPLQQSTETGDALDNVVQLPVDSPLDAPVGLSSLGPGNTGTQVGGHETTQPRVAPLPAGLLDAPDLRAFFEQSHFGLGRHNGAHSRTQDALSLGRDALVAKFQNKLEAMVLQRSARIDALRNMALQTSGVCATVTNQLNLACQRLERDIATLQAQTELASQHKGWVLTALNEYQIGFGQGLREAVEYELLGQPV